ncbi:hypothetical protein KIP88_34765 [Bradyrhizobium sp. SRL28]|uniref:hypothetical protein n=1 Tax=Bradyrhizobium sp. SRL28 TaxID=2836178 RepID=UPI001BDEA36B|nr:hypothetical protein [Bradyrhizobium sp. SRL28]MBT1515645.1 hypothetical protein [Bradyrhizobium sp. SRL28]
MDSNSGSAFKRIVGVDHGYAMGIKQIVQTIPYARQRGRGPTSPMPERLQDLIDFHSIDGIVRVNQGKEQFARCAAASHVTRNEIGPRDRCKLNRRLQYGFVGSVGRQLGEKEIDAIGRAAQGIGEFARQAPDRVQHICIGFRQALFRRDTRLSCPRESGPNFQGCCARIDSQEAEWLS